MIIYTTSDPVVYDSPLLSLWASDPDDDMDAVNLAEWFIDDNDVRFLPCVLSLR